MEEGRYPLYTQNGKKYVTIGYKQSESTGAIARQGPHHGAQKSTITSLSDLMTSSSN